MPYLHYSLLLFSFFIIVFYQLPRHGLFESWLKATQDFNFSWGSAYKPHLKRLQSKHNIFLSLKFFATTSGPQTVSALPFINPLDALTVNNFYRLHALKFTHRSNTPVNCVLVLTMGNWTNCFLSGNITPLERPQCIFLCHRNKTFTVRKIL